MSLIAYNDGYHWSSQLDGCSHVQVHVLYTQSVNQMCFTINVFLFGFKGLADHTVEVSTMQFDSSSLCQYPNIFPLKVSHSMWRLIGNNWVLKCNMGDPLLNKIKKKNGKCVTSQINNIQHRTVLSSYTGNGNNVQHYGILTCTTLLIAVLRSSVVHAFKSVYSTNDKRF